MSSQKGPIYIPFRLGWQPNQLLLDEKRAFTPPMPACTHAPARTHTNTCTDAVLLEHNIHTRNTTEKISMTRSGSTQQNSTEQNKHTL